MIEVTCDSFPIRGVFNIARGSRTQTDVVTVRVTREGASGYGECVPYKRYGESVEAVLSQIRNLPAGISRAELQHALPAGAARNAVDCALWDLEAKQSGVPVWQLAGLSAPHPCVTAYTLSLDTPEAMGLQARENAWRPLLKVKLGTPDDMPRLEAVRVGAPESRLIIDANEGWSVADYLALAPRLRQLGVELTEQPLPADRDSSLLGVRAEVPLCADESCHDRASLPALVGKYQYINIKLDKTGGLTEALALRAEARAMGFKIMVGCMIGSSLAMAPALLVAQGAEVVDLDGPLLLAQDREHALTYDAAGVHPPEPRLWG